MLNLFKGAIGMFKNPTSHRAVKYEDPAVASDAVLLADLLLRLLDGVEARPAA
ncbi:TIGR02391 family protein [Amycolatopsis sp. NBC_01307]|uniref:TIGR02391 family protein n=1 Tax=Amycolatopsis sp. NBC_01307 TaxID=2903561 RepID=UPI003FA37C2C